MSALLIEVVIIAIVVVVVGIVGIVVDGGRKYKVNSGRLQLSYMVAYITIAKKSVNGRRLQVGAVKNNGIKLLTDLSKKSRRRIKRGMDKLRKNTHNDQIK